MKARRVSSTARLTSSGFRPWREIAHRQADGSHKDTWKLQADHELVDSRAGSRETDSEMTGASQRHSHRCDTDHSNSANGVSLTPLVQDQKAIAGSALQQMRAPTSQWQNFDHHWFTGDSSGTTRGFVEARQRKLKRYSAEICKNGSVYASPRTARALVGFST